MAAVADRLVELALAALVLRHAIVAFAVVRSVRFLGGVRSIGADHPITPAFRWYIVLPVLRERGVADAVRHFREVAAAVAAEVVVVTGEREYTERCLHPGTPDTVQRVRELAAAGECIHLHCPDPLGVKADQLNCAVTWLTARLEPGDASRTFIVCYDVDSRPPTEALLQMRQAVLDHPTADVFHQSARFRLASSARGRGWRALLDAGALRANRFVLAYELPRLLSRLSGNRLRATVSAWSYAHVTGHGLCVRLTLLAAIPFPARTPLEDMHWSFIIGTRRIAMVPVRSLDVSEVPDSVTAQVRQASRWVAGPARAWGYLRDPATRPTATAHLIAASATGITLEWVSCAVVPALLVCLLAVGSWPDRLLTVAFIACYGLQLGVTDGALASHMSLSSRIGRFLLYPLNSTLFGIGGIIGIGSLVAGKGGAGKTERMC